MSDLVVLDADAADLLAEIHASAFDRPWDAGDLADMMSGHGAHLLALRAEGRIEGFILFQAVAGEAEILTLAVRPDARRRGFGLILVEGAAAKAQAAGAATLWLDVAADNESALGLYSRAGFETLGRRRGYYRIGPNHSVDAIVMRRALNTAPASHYSP
ncbi:MAG TPA: ribosomal protein S18-alanine N-acetyltransferase [Caulobacteraceae bacterium]|jgi:ribosomal-protein-alanine N-acetyltransferase|nr:ribosomal protein S18-alanine N-acetyltransferase [Caulobacteraceae bacterium]